MAKVRASFEDMKRLLLSKQVLGVTENPKNSNHVKFWVDLIRWKLAAAFFNGQPWCRALIVWTCRKLGLPILPIQSPYYCPSAVQYARAHGLLDTSGLYQPGDEVYFAFSVLAQRAGLAEHVERVLSDDGVTMTTVGGNTSSGDGGSQDNGGGVFKRRRLHGPTVLGALSYHKLLGQGEPPKHKVRRNPFARALRGVQLPVRIGDRGDAVRGVQWAVGVPVDGVFGELTDHGVRHFQRYHVDQRGRGLISDGEVGRLTREALLKITHFEH